MVINCVLELIIPIITVYEHLGSKTLYYYSIVIKLSLANFINYGVIPLITYNKSVYFTSGGFLMTIWMNWLFICFLDPLLEFFDIFYMLYLLKWWWIKRKGPNSELTQLQANEAANPYEMSIVNKFAQIINIMLYTSFYIILFPPGIIITTFGLIVQYWLTKYLLITRYKVEKINSEIALYSMDFLSYLFPLITLAKFTFLKRIPVAF